jgi:hypothetical protein
MMARGAGRAKRNANVTQGRMGVKKLA